MSFKHLAIWRPVQPNRRPARSRPLLSAIIILGAGLVASLARPGGTTTGLTIFSPELSAKRLEVLRDIIPGLSRVASFWDPTTGASQVALTEKAAQSLQIRLKVLEVRGRSDLAGAFLTAKAEQAEALNVFSSPFLSSLYRDIINLAFEHGVAAIYRCARSAISGSARDVVVNRQEAAICKLSFLEGKTTRYLSCLSAADRSI
jgi:ABC-type uncharacterized transport system substrate-binding protein